MHVSGLEDCKLCFSLLSKALLHIQKHGRPVIIQIMNTLLRLTASVANGCENKSDFKVVIRSAAGTTC